ncbi:MAG TPA: hypothetical protein VK992_05705, partial [Candidatus Caenarcaniphilales bacterium]|nr:hypothetical protein [Candidatus Caenarcaniphilales bacterium]
AHLTVARGADERLLEDLRRLAPASGVGWVFHRVALLRSHTGREGARYELLAEVPLAGSVDAAAQST